MGERFFEEYEGRGWIIRHALVAEPAEVDLQGLPELQSIRIELESRTGGSRCQARLVSRLGSVLSSIEVGQERVIAFEQLAGDQIIAASERLDFAFRCIRRIVRF